MIRFAPLSTSDIRLSSEMPTISVLTDRPYVDITISSSFRRVLSSRYYPIDGRISLHNLVVIVEHEMQWAGVAMDTFIFEASYGNDSADQASLSATIVYCSRFVECDDLKAVLSQHFLSPATGRRIARGASVWLSAYIPASERYSLSAVCRYRLPSTEGSSVEPSDGASTSQYGSVSFLLDEYNDTSNPSATAQVIPNVISTNRLQAMLEEAVGKGAQLLSFTAQCGARTAEFFIDDALSMNSAFYFRNCFNAIDQVFILGVTTAKTNSERSLASIGERSEQYDIRLQLEHQLESSAISAGESLLIEQLIASHDVRRPWAGDPYDCDFDSLTPILITDSTCEMATNAAELAKVKFVWRYAHNRLPQSVSISSDIFTSPFNPIFS